MNRVLCVGILQVGGSCSVLVGPAASVWGGGSLGHDGGVCSAGPAAAPGSWAAWAVCCGTSPSSFWTQWRDEGQSGAFTICFSLWFLLQKPTAAMLDQPWCELSQEAAPFPEPSPPSPEVSSSPEPPDRTQQHPSEQPQPAPAPPKSQLQPRDKTASLGGLSSRVQPPPLARAGPSGVVRGGEGRKEPERGVKRQFFPEQPRAAEAVEEEEEVQKKRLEEAAAGGAGGLQSCPMCLLVFPAG